MAKQPNILGTGSPIATAAQAVSSLIPGGGLVGMLGGPAVKGLSELLKHSGLLKENKLLDDFRYAEANKTVAETNAAMEQNRSMGTDTRQARARIEDIMGSVSGAAANVGASQGAASGLGGDITSVV